MRLTLEFSCPTPCRWENRGGDCLVGFALQISRESSQTQVIPRDSSFDPYSGQVDGCPDSLKSHFRPLRRLLSRSKNDADGHFIVCLAATGEKEHWPGTCGIESNV